MLCERGVSIDHSTIYRWVLRYAPKMEDCLRCYPKRPSFTRSSRGDETYIQLKGKWKYLYRVVDESGDTIYFFVPQILDAKADQTRLGQGRKRLKDQDDQHS